MKARLMAHQAQKQVDPCPVNNGFILSRAKRNDSAQVAEARELLAPLTDTLARISLCQRRETGVFEFCEGKYPEP